MPARRQYKRLFSQGIPARGKSPYHRVEKLSRLPDGIQGPERWVDFEKHGIQAWARSPFGWLPVAFVDAPYKVLDRRTTTHRSKRIGRYHSPPARLGPMAGLVERETPLTATGVVRPARFARFLFPPEMKGHGWRGEYAAEADPYLFELATQCAHDRRRGPPHDMPGPKSPAGPRKKHVPYQSIWHYRNGCNRTPLVGGFNGIVRS